MIQKPDNNIPSACSIGRHDECCQTGCKWKIVLNEYCWNKRLNERVKISEPQPLPVRISYVTAEDTTPFFPRKRAKKQSSLVQNQEGVRRIVYRRDGYVCLKCGTRDNLTLDEVIPKSKGGKRTVENCQTLCSKCNGEKGARTIDYRKKEEEIDLTKIKTPVQDDWIKKIKVENESKF